MTERKRNLVVGITTLAGILGLVALVLIFGYMPRFMKSGYLVQIDLPRAAGLHSTSTISLSGIPIGEVERVELREPAGVRVFARIRDDVRVPATAVPRVTQPLIGGSSSIEFLFNDTGEDVAYLPRDGATVEGEIPSLTMSVDRVVGNLERVSQNFEALSAEWTRVGTNINALVELRSPDAVDNGEAAGNLATVLQRTDRRLAELEAVLAGIDRYTGDESLHADIAATAASARSVSEKASASLDTIQERYVALADRLALAIDSIRGVATAAQEGDGTLGRLLQDPRLYNNLNDAAERLQATLDETRLLIQKWKAEGLPVQF